MNVTFKCDIQIKNNEMLHLRNKNYFIDDMKISLRLQIIQSLP